jgi:predicted ATPase/DNA-binding CsgD family transcriptional regulator
VESALSAPASNLPADATKFIGRKTELAEARGIICAHRLVTLTGLGGVGKTRLALQMATRLQRHFPDGTVLIELAGVREPELVVHTVANAVGMLDLSEDNPDVALSRYLADKHMLLLLDNCEHLLGACGALCENLLRECPKLHILATSRELLGIAEETTWAIGPLSLPDADSTITPRDLARYDAISLFVDRARQSVPDFEITERNADTMVALCRWLDGLPLAIELAVVLLRSLSPQQLLDRLSSRYALLARERGEPVRQRTLWDCVEWSYELCSAEEQLLWKRLSVFAGGFELDAVEGVCGGNGLEVSAVLFRLSGLVDKSIVIVDRGPRFRMLETIREFGLTKLRDSGREAVLRNRHRAWYERMLQQADAEWLSPWQEYWLARLNSEHANISAALQYCLSEPRLTDSALNLAIRPWRFYWWAPGRVGEGRLWLDQAIAHATEGNAAYAKAVLLDAQLTAVQGDFDTAQSLLEEGCRIAERLDDPATTARSEYSRGHLAMWSDRDLDAAIKHYERAVTVPGWQSDLNQRAEGLLALVVCTGLIADEERANAYHQELLAITQPTGELRHRAHSLYGLGLCAWLRGNLRRATLLQQESIRLKQGIRDLQGIAFSLEALVCVAVAEDQVQRAATLLGAAELFWRAMGTSLSAFRPLYWRHVDCVQCCHAMLSRRQYDAAFKHGMSFTVDEAVAYALGESPRPAPTQPPADRVTLTRREREVAELLTQGLTNRQIAESLVISPRTAECHVENILVKLGFTSRDQVATWVSAQG